MKENFARSFFLKKVKHLVGSFSNKLTGFELKVASSYFYFYSSFYLEKPVMTDFKVNNKDTRAMSRLC